MRGPDNLNVQPIPLLKLGLLFHDEDEDLFWNREFHLVIRVALDLDAIPVRVRDLSIQQAFNAHVVPH